MKFKCYLNGAEISDQGLIAALNQNEISVFESLRVYHGVVFRFDEHLKRFVSSAKACGISLPTASVLKKEIEKTLRVCGAKDGFIRVQFQNEKIIVMLGERKHSESIYRQGVDLKTSSFRAPSPKESDPQSKTGNYRMQLLAGKPDGAFEWLFLDPNHCLTEARVGNFFIVKKGAVLTPPALSLLNGITREVVIECARESGLFVQETPLTRHEAFNADEAFLTNTSWEILPVRSLDGRSFKEPVTGPITHKLIKCFHRKVQNACQPQKKASLTQKSNARLSPSRIKKG